jgi:hypothetical protein
MSARDELDEQASELFRAARSDRPSGAARERALGAFAARRSEAPAEPDSVVPASDETAPRATKEAARVRRAPFSVAAGFAAAAAVTLIIAVRHAKSPLAISSERVLRPARTLIVSTAAEPEPPTLEAPTPKPRLIGSAHAALPRRPESPESPESSASSASSVSAPVIPPRVASLSDEIAALDQVRQSLASGDATGALAKLDDYENVLGGTRLVAEAALLRIQALASAGRTAEASRRARRFIEENPGSPLVDRARGFVRE